MENRRAAIAAICTKLRNVVEEFDRLGLTLAAALASQALDEALTIRDLLIH